MQRIDLFARSCQGRSFTSQEVFFNVRITKLVIKYDGMDSTDLLQSDGTIFIKLQFDQKENVLTACRNNVVILNCSRLLLFNVNEKWQFLRAQK